MIALADDSLRRGGIVWFAGAGNGWLRTSTAMSVVSAAMGAVR